MKACCIYADFNIKKSYKIFFIDFMARICLIAMIKHIYIIYNTKIEYKKQLN